MKKSIIGLSAIACLLLGCEPCPHYNRIQSISPNGAPLAGVNKQEKKPYGSVKLFENKEQVPGKYDVLALMTLEGSAGDDARFMTAFLYRAADLGANGVIIYRGAQTAVSSPGPFFHHGAFCPDCLSR
jgi:hypothetical protein